MPLTNRPHTKNPPQTLVGRRPKSHSRLARQHALRRHPKASSTPQWRPRFVDQMWPEFGVGFEQVELEIGKKLIQNLAALWPDPWPESGQSFWARFLKYLKIPFLEVILGLEGRATFWPMAWPKSGQVLDQLFSNFQFNLFETDSELGPHLALKSLPPFWRESGLWGEVSGFVARDLSCDLRRRLKGLWRILLETS